MFRLLLVAASVGVVAVLAGVSVAVVATDGGPALMVGQLEEAPIAPEDPRCASRTRSAAGAAIWRRQWRVQGEMSGMEGRFRGFRTVGDRGVVLWRDQRWHDAVMPRTIEGDWIAEGMFHLSAIGDVPFGFSFELLDPDAGHLCRLNVTAPLERGNVTLSWAPVSPVKWTALRNGERVATTTRRGEHFVVTRTAEATWEFDVTGETRAPDYFRRLTLRITADQPAPPWDSIDIEVASDGLLWGARGHLELRPPVRCPDERGRHRVRCD